jgi:hypothetical protein
MCVWGFFGLPLCSLASALGFFVSGAMGTNQSIWTQLSFVIAAALISILSLSIKNIQRLKQVLLAANGLFCLILPFLRFSTSGTGWLQALQHNMVAMMFIEMTLVSRSVWCFFALYKSMQFEGQKTLQTTAAFTTQETAK